MKGGESADAILYVGLGMIFVGLVITVVGLGDKGFQTLELKVVGPSIVLCGILLACLRIFICMVPYWCCDRGRGDRGKGDKLIQCQCDQNTDLRGRRETTLATIASRQIKQRVAVGGCCRQNNCENVPDCDWTESYSHVFICDGSSKNLRAGGIVQNAVKFDLEEK